MKSKGDSRSSAFDKAVLILVYNHFVFSVHSSLCKPRFIKALWGQQESLHYLGNEDLDSDPESFCCLQDWAMWLAKLLTPPSSAVVCHPYDNLHIGIILACGLIFSVPAACCSCSPDFVWCGMALHPGTILLCRYAICSSSAMSSSFSPLWKVYIWLCDS